MSAPRTMRELAADLTLTDDDLGLIETAAARVREQLWSDQAAHIAWLELAPDDQTAAVIAIALDTFRELAE